MADSAGHPGQPAHTTGTRILALRERLGWSQEAMGRALGVSQSHVCDLERGRRSSPGSGSLRVVLSLLEDRTASADIGTVLQTWPVAF